MRSDEAIMVTPPRLRLQPPLNSSNDKTSTDVSTNIAIFLLLTYAFRPAVPQ